MGIGVLYWIQPGKPFPSLEQWAHIADMLIAGTAIFAVITFYYQRETNKVVFALDRINFFRENVLSLDNKLFKAFQNSTLYYETSSIRISTFDLERYTKEFPEKVQDQKASRLVRLAGLPKYKEIEDTENELLNALEEFSVGVIYTGINNHDSTRTIRKAFVEIVERNAFKVLLMAQQEKFMQETSRLYLLWRDSIVRG